MDASEATDHDHPLIVCRGYLRLHVIFRHIDQAVLDCTTSCTMQPIFNVFANTAKRLAGRGIKAHRLATCGGRFETQPEYGSCCYLSLGTV